MAIPAAVLTGWVEHVEPYDWNEVDRIPERIAALVRAQGLERARTGLELARLPAQTHADVRRHLPGATFEDASGLIMGVRLIKSAAELDCMRRAARMTVAGVEASYQAIAPGRTDNDVARAGYDAMVAAGSEFRRSTIVTAGHRSMAHTSFKRNALKVGDVVFLNTAAATSGTPRPIPDRRDRQPSAAVAGRMPPGPPWSSSSRTSGPAGARRRRPRRPTRARRRRRDLLPGGLRRATGNLRRRWSKVRP
jgi:hypothetical protein